MCNAKQLRAAFLLALILLTGPWGLVLGALWYFCWLSKELFGPAVLRIYGISALAIGLPACLLWLGASWVPMAAGVASWAAAVALKMPTYKLLNRGLRIKTPLAIAIEDGVASGALELGFGAIYLAFAWHTLSLLDVIAFGGAVGAWEVFFVIGLGIYQVRTAATTAGAPEPGSITAQPEGAEVVTAPAATWWRNNAMVVERYTAALGHIGSRGMLFAAIATGAWWLIPLAVALFAAVDGTVVYGAIYKWNWIEPSTARRFYSFIGTIGIIEMVLFLLFTP